MAPAPTLLTLPAEIRMQIFTEVLTMPSRRATLYDSRDNFCLDPERIRKIAPASSLLRTNKQIYQEARCIPWEQNCFVFKVYSRDFDLGTVPDSSYNISRISHFLLELEFYWNGEDGELNTRAQSLGWNCAIRMGQWIRPAHIAARQSIAINGRMLGIFDVEGPPSSRELVDEIRPLVEFMKSGATGSGTAQYAGLREMRRKCHLHRVLKQGIVDCVHGVCTIDEVVTALRKGLGGKIWVKDENGSLIRKDGIQVRKVEEVEGSEARRV